MYDLILLLLPKTWSPLGVCAFILVCMMQMMMHMNALKLIMIMYSEHTHGLMVLLLSRILKRMVPSLTHLIF